jgi:hypothetical protein
MPLKFRFRRWWIAVLLAAVVLSVWLLFLTRLKEPVYQGRRLGDWLRGHPKDYYPAVLAAGTNALPYLLAELQATDSRVSQWGQHVLAKVSIGPSWRTASDRQYHARLGLQILDTNAVPALLNVVFAQPMRMAEGDPGLAAARALSWLVSPAAQHMAEARLALALDSPDAEECRNACLAFSVWPRSRDDIASSLAALSRSPNATVRAAALRAIMFSGWREDLFLSPLISCLEDEQASVRRLAVEVLSAQGSNAVAALPALRAAYAKEWVQANLRGDLGDGVFGAHSWSATEIRSAIREAIKAIDPAAPLPADPP